MTYSTGTGRHRVQIIYFLWIQIGSWTPSGIGLVSDSRLDRMRRFLVLPRELWIKTWGTWAPARWLAERIASYVSTDGSASAYDVGACARLVSSLSGPRETSGPQIDRIPPARPSWWDRQYREFKKLFFSPPGKCHINLSGPRANRTTHDGSVAQIVGSPTPSTRGDTTN